MRPEARRDVIESPELRAFRKTHPPFEVPFDPEEGLIKVQQAPRAERPTLFAQYKEKLLAQEEAWAACRIAIEHTLEDNHDASFEELCGIINEFSRSYSFSYDQIKHAQRFLAEFSKLRERMKETRKEFPDNHELVQHLTGMPMSPETPLTVTTGPMNFDVVTDAKTADKIYGAKSDGEMERYPYAAFATRSDLGVPYSIYKQKEGSQATTFKHEFEHQKNQIFAKQFDRDFSAYIYETDLELFDQATDDEMRRFYAEMVAKEDQRYALDRAKDELLAVGIEGKKRMRSFAPLLKERDPKNGHNSYDYLRHMRERYDKHPILKDTFDRVCVAEYDRIIDTAIDAYTMLERIYSNEQIAGLLTPYPLEHWMKFATRVYQNELKDQTLKASEMQALARDQEKRDAVKAKLTRRALLTGSGAAVAVGAMGTGAMVLDKSKTTHEALRNQTTIETPHATYNILYIGDVLDPNPEILNQADVLVLEFDSYIQGERGHGSQLMAHIYGEVQEGTNPYTHLVQEAERRNIPVVPIGGGRQQDGKHLDALRAGVYGSLFVAGAGLLNEASKDLSTRRSFLKGFGKAVAGWGAMAPFGLKFGKISAPYEPDTGSLGHQIERRGNELDSVIGDRSLLSRARSIAIDAEYVARNQEYVLGRRPRISVVVHRELTGIEQELETISRIEDLGAR